MQGLQDKLQNSLTSMTEKLEHGYLRKMQRDMYQCCVYCFDKKSLSTESTQHCVETCSLPLVNSKEAIESEMNSFQNRLQRCSLDCQDQIKDKMAGVSNQDVSKFQAEFEGCVLKCGENQLKLIPSLMKRCEETLKTQQKQLNSLLS